VGVRADRPERLRGRKVLLFDFDGTLIHQTIDFGEMRRLAEAVLREYGASPEAWKDLFVLEAIERAAAVVRPTDPERAEAMRARAMRAIVDLELSAAEGARACSGVPEMLQTLRRTGLAVAIVTRNCREAVLAVMARNRLACDLLLTRDDVQHVKPDPRHLLAALEALGASPGDAVMAGDHPTDVLAGRRAGTATVGVLSPGVGPEWFASADPDLIVEDVTEIVSYL